MTESKKRIALKPHMKQIREWVDAGKTDDWIADALGTSASSVQSFRSRNDIYRRDRALREPGSTFEGVLDHGERDGWGLWFDPSVADDPIWREYWSKIDSVVVKVAEDFIILEALSSGGQQQGQQEGVDGGAGLQTTALAVEDVSDAPPAQKAPVNGSSPRLEAPEPDREQGRVKWFDPEKGYGFLVRPTGEDLFVHHSEVEGDPSALEPGGNVGYVVGHNDRGPNARSVRIVE
jgi:cold shock CspA family protein